MIFIACLYIINISIFHHSLQVINCTSPNIAFGTQSPSTSPVDFNITVTYACDTGYEITSGDAVRICDSSSDLSGTLPVCSSRFSVLIYRNTIKILQRLCFFCACRLCNLQHFRIFLNNYCCCCIQIQIGHHVNIISSLFQLCRKIMIILII